MLNILPITCLPQGVDEDTILQYANALNQQRFKSLLDYLNDAYHNGPSIISDITFDLLEELYEEKYEPYEVIGAEPNVPTREKVLLPYFLSSLNKIKEEPEISRFSKNYPGPYIVMDKVDGITVLLLHYVNGVNKLYTRGKGVKGTDVSHLLDYVKLPPLKFNFDISIRGEFVLNKEVFERIGKEYLNTRNMTAGKVMSKKSFDPNIAKEFSFYAYRIMNGFLTPEQDIQCLTNLGFLVPNPVTTTVITKETLESYLQTRKGLAAYDIDGLVIYQNKPINYPNDGNPKQVIAYKEETETAKVIVTQVIWQGSRGRKLKPVVIYESTFLSGANLTNATAHNARFVINGNINVGATILITRSGETIPKVLLTVEPSTFGPAYPDPNIVGKYNWNENQVEFILEEDNDEVIGARLEHFLTTLEIDKVGPGRIKVLMKSGIKDINSLTSMTPSWLINIEGFGNKLSNDVCNDIQLKIKNIPLAKLMDASGIFYGIGTKRTDQVVDAYPNILDLASTDKQIIANYISSLNGFGNILADTFAEALPLFVNWLKQHPQITIGQKQQIIQQVNVKRLDGMTIVVSGTRDKDLFQEITTRGGKIGSDVTKNTTILVVKDINNTTGKVNKAIKFGTTIMSIDDFRAKYL